RGRSLCFVLEMINQVKPPDTCSVQAPSGGVTNDDKPFAPNPQHNDEELSFDEDLDRWLKAEMEKHMCGQDKESEEDALIDIFKSLVGEWKSFYTKKNT
ncbi:hypothetical protein Tco_0172195, partial [Tanacetum coccineum]